MKKLTTLVLAAGLVVSFFAGSASAAEFKPFAQFAEEFTYGDAGKQSPERFNAATRIRFGFDYVASEDLSATMLFQYMNANWGNNADFTADPAANLQMRLAYIDWTLPTTDVKVRMGRQAVVAPSYAFGSAILDGRADAVSFNGNVNDNIALGLTWFRLDSATGGYKANDDADAVMLTSEFAYDGFKMAPWAMYVSKQANAFNGRNEITGQQLPGIGVDSYTIGASAELSMFDPFVFAVDALYQNTKTQNPADKNQDFDGFFVGAKAAYKLANGTAALKGWWATGTDESKANNDNKGLFALDGGFSATTMLYGDNIIGKDAYNTLTGDSPFGTWGLVAEYAGFSFMDKLTHTARVAYIQGTNELAKADYAGRGLDFEKLTDEDSLIEVDFNSTYEIYKKLSATLELGYIFVDQDKLGGNKEADDIFRSALTFVYNF